MKYIFYSLLLANLAYLGFRYLADPPDVTQSVEEKLSSEASSRLLVLLEETGRSAAEVRNQALESVIANPVAAVDSPVSAGAAASVPEKQEETVPICKALGPFTDMNEGQDLVERLMALGVEVTLQAIDKTLEENDYRLMVSPAANLQSAFSRHQQLKSGGVESFVITQGRYKYAVSLGVFSNEEGAQRAQSALPDYGLPLEIIETPRIGREYWVIPSQGPQLAIGEALWDVIADKRPGIRRQLMACVD